MAQSTTLYRGDSLAQTFFVNSGKHPLGIFLTKIQLFFQEKDDSFPVFLEIREVLNGFPSSDEVVPGTDVAVNPADVKVPTTVTDIDNILANPTDFTFDAPVHLAPGGEYAIIVYSNSDNHRVYTAQIGEKVVGLQTQITRQPYSGVLFKSSNSSTYEPDSTQDLMFKIFKANFTTNEDKVALFKSQEMTLTTRQGMNANGIHQTIGDIPSARRELNTGGFRYDFLLGQLNDITFNDTADIDYRIKTTPESSNTLATSFSTYNPEGDNYFTSRQIFKANGAITVQATLKSNNPDVSPVIDQRGMNFIYIKNELNNAELSNDLGVINLYGGSNYRAAPTVTISAPTGPSGVTATAVAVVNSAASNSVERLVFTNKGSGYIETPTITFTGGSPVGSNLATATVSGETSPSGGNIISKYITRIITLEDGFDANSVRIIFDAYRKAHSQFAVYVKAKADEDQTNFDDLPYVLCTEVGTAPASVQEDEFIEYQFQAPDPITYTAGGITYNNFKQFAVKIAMYGSNPTDVPRIKNFRAIAVD